MLHPGQDTHLLQGAVRVVTEHVELAMPEPPSQPVVRLLAPPLERCGGQSKQGSRSTAALNTEPRQRGADSGFGCPMGLVQHDCMSAQQPLIVVPVADAAELRLRGHHYRNR